MEALQTALDAAAVSARLAGDATVAARIEVVVAEIAATEDVEEITTLAEEALVLLQGVEEAEDDAGVVEWIVGGLRAAEALE